MTYRARRDRDIAERLHRDNLARLASLFRKMESGEIPSAIYDGTRVTVHLVQDHPVAGLRYFVGDGLSRWVPATSVSELRGTPRVSVVPDSYRERVR